MKLKFSTHTIVTLCLCGSLLLQPAWAVINPKPASEFTIQANQNVLHTLPFNDKQDFEDARRGFIAKPDTLTIKDEQGNVVWDLEQYKTYIGLDKTAPDTVNPSLWRNAQLNMEYGLFKVTDKIYQIRGFDLSNITFIQGDKGWIVFDPLISPQTAKAALAFINKTLGERPVTAVVYSHSHVDHYGGAAGLFNSPDEVKKNGVQIIAPRRVHRACGLGKRHRRQRHGPPRRLHVWRPAAAQCPGRREWRPGADYLHRRALPAAADPFHHQEWGRGHSGRRADGLPDDPGHRSAGRDEHLVPGQQGALDGREHHQHHAQHPHPARRPGT